LWKICFPQQKKTKMKINEVCRTDEMPVPLSF